MDLGLNGKRVLITGATRGIGRAILDLLVAEGATVATCARGEAGVSALEAAHPGRVYASALDVRDGARFSAWVGDAIAKLGGADIVISNVSTRVTAKGDAMWQETFETDLRQHARLAELTLPALHQGKDSSLLFISSIAAVLTLLPPGEDVYGMMKAALASLSGQLAQKHGPKGVRVNCLSPGPIFFEGGVWDQIQKANPALFAGAAKLAALGRHGTPQEVAKAAVFLASPAASYITGANLRIDGGAVKTVSF